MLTGLAIILLAGLAFDWAAGRLRMPGLLGLLLLGLLLGPFALNLLDARLYAVAAELRTLALVVILLRAGFEMNRPALARVGGRALLLACVPCLCEAACVTWLAPRLLPLSRLEGAMLGAILGASSPAVIVPYMIRFNQERRGTAKGIPTLVLAGSTGDNAFAILLATSLVGVYSAGLGRALNLGMRLAGIPVAVVTGLLAGLAVGWLLECTFRRFNPRATKRLLALLAAAVLLLAVQARVERVLPFSALMAILAVGVTLFELNAVAAHELAAKLGKTWIFAQLLLFVLIGAQVNARLAASAGLAGAAVVVAGLFARALAVWLCLWRSGLDARERGFVLAASLPKATVQAAIGAVPLAAMATHGLPTAPGDLILAVAVLSILVTAPLGAFLIGHVGERVLVPLREGMEREGQPTERRG